jgi:hypothetical protein
MKAPRCPGCGGSEFELLSENEGLLCDKNGWLWTLDGHHVREVAVGDLLLCNECAEELKVKSI